MILARESIAVLLSLVFVLSACNTQKPNMTPTERKAAEEQKARPNTITIEPGSYTITAACVDSAKADLFKDLQWVMLFREDGHYITKMQNLDPNCKELCSAVEGGTFTSTEVQVEFKTGQKLNIEKNEFETAATPTSKIYFLMTYDRLFDKLVLIDTSIDNSCKGKMILTLQK